MSKQPDIKLKSNISYGIQLAGWVGEKGTSFKLSKRYKDKDNGEWKETDWLNAQDLAALSFLIAPAIAQSQNLEITRKEKKENGDTYIRTVDANESQTVDDSEVPF